MSCTYVSPSRRACVYPADRDDPQGLCLFHSRNKAKDKSQFLQRLKRQLQMGNFDFTGYIFPAPMSFRNLSFERPVSFMGAMFLGGADFSGARFSGTATSFTGAYFGGKGAWFDQTTFTGQKLSFRRMRVCGDRLTFKRARIASAETCFDEAQLELRTLCLIQSHFTGDTITLQGLRCDCHIWTMEQARLESQQWRMDKSVFRCRGIVADGLRTSGRYFGIVESTFDADTFSGVEMASEAETIALDGTQITAPQIILARSRWSAADLLSWTNVRLAGETVDLEASRFTAPRIDLSGLHIEAQTFRCGGSRFEGGILNLGRWRLEAGCVDLSDVTLEAGEANLSEWSWKGEELLLERLEAETNEITLSNSDLSGKRFSMQEAEFRGGVCAIQGSQMAVDRIDWANARFASQRTLIRRNTFLGTTSFDGVTFLGDEAILWHNQYRGPMASLRQARFPTRGSWIAEDTSRLSLSGASVARVDFSGSHWTRHGGRDRCLDEMIAGDTESLAEAADLYRQLKESHMRSGARRQAGDFLVGEIECYRRLAREHHLHRLAMVMGLLNVLCGYYERPWRITGWSCILGLSIVVLNAIAGSPYWIWPITNYLGGTANHLAFSWKTVFPILETILFLAALGFTGYVWRRSRRRPFNSTIFRQAVPSVSRTMRELRERSEHDERMYGSL